MHISYSISSSYSASVHALQTPLLPIVILLLFVVVYLLRQWWKPKDEHRRLPPGSMGWPYMGETLKLYTENPNSFFSTRQKRYGEIFKTHLLGCRCVMITSPEAAKLVLVSKAHLFKPSYPPSKELLIGPHALFFHQGPYHSRLKKLLLSSFLPSSLSAFVPQIDAIVHGFLPSWKDKTVNTLQEMKKYAFEVAMMAVFGESRGEVGVEKIKKLYHCLEKGYNSMPLNLPGTPFHNSFKARKLLNETLKKLITKRRAKKEFKGGLLGVLLNSTHQKPQQDYDYSLSDSQIADNIIGVIFAAHDTTASALTWVIKYLHDNQDLLDVAPGANTYMPFGKGVHSCPGSGLAKLEMLLLLHHLTTSFRWEVVGDDDGIQYGPFPVPKHGLPIRVHSRNVHTEKFLQ